jgi:hypothetical protein
MKCLAVVVLLVACSSSSSMDRPDHPDASTTTPDAPAQQSVAKVGGVIAIAERKAFCEQLSQCSDLTYTECIEAVDHSATVQPAIAGCTAPAKLEAVMVCAKSNNICSSTACNAALDTWAQTYASVNCEVDVSSVGIGDRYEIFGGADSQCDGGIRADGGWCTRACSTAQSCTGSGAGGNNHFGTPNVCGHDSLPQGFGCYPTCTSTAHCQAWFGETRFGLRIACKQFSDGSAPAPICVRVSDNRGVELP